MNKYKFRAWYYSKDYPEFSHMTFVCSIDFVKRKAKIGVLENICKFDEIELMQYTGIKDKNGVEIYEGDVFIDEDGCIGVVRYSEQYAWFIIEWYENSHSKEPIDDDPLGNINIHNMEVIGNIYENKELLKNE